MERSLPMEIVRVTEVATDEAAKQSMRNVDY